MTPFTRISFSVLSFPPLFEDIERQIKDGQEIDSYGTSMPTLEEVFLRLGDEALESDVSK